MKDRIVKLLATLLADQERSEVWIVMKSEN